MPFSNPGQTKIQDDFVPKGYYVPKGYITVTLVQGDSLDWTSDDCMDECLTLVNDCAAQDSYNYGGSLTTTWKDGPAIQVNITMGKGFYQ